MKIKFESETDCKNFGMYLGVELDNTVKSLYVGETFEVGYRKKPFVNKCNKVSNKAWEKHWLDMPEFYQGYPSIYNEIEIKSEDFTVIHNLLDIKVDTKINSFWFPKKKKSSYTESWFRGSETEKNNYPIYIPSLGRWDCCHTAHSLIKLGIDNYYIVVESEEFDKYKSNFPENNLIVLDESYKRDYQTLDFKYEDKRVGPGAARNFAWDHSIANGYKWHWVLDDNITQFCRFFNNKKVPIKTSAIFKITEDFIQRFSNVGMGGMNYRFFCVHNVPAFRINTRIYSCNFIRNDLPFRWRGRYNEDTILSLDMITNGWNTIQFNLFLIDKMATQTLKGGNNDLFYKSEGTKEKSKMLYDVYPQFTKLVTKYGRDHHYINYTPFGENVELLYEERNIERSKKVNEHGIYFG